MPIAKALHVSGTTAKGGGPTASLAFRVARRADAGVDDVLTGRFPAHGTCPHCGHCQESRYWTRDFWHMRIA